MIDTRAAGWLTRQETAAVLGCHVNSVDRLARDRILTRHRRPGLNPHRVYFLRAQVESLVESTPEDIDA